MLRCSNYCGDEILINLPTTSVWSITMRVCADESNDDYSLYLMIDQEKILLRDIDYWCRGRELPLSAVGDLYKEIIDTITYILKDNPTTTCINIDKIEDELISECFGMKRSGCRAKDAFDP